MVSATTPRRWFLDCPNDRDDQHQALARQPEGVGVSERAEQSAAGNSQTDHVFTAGCEVTT